MPPLTGSLTDYGAFLCGVILNLVFDFNFEIFLLSELFCLIESLVLEARYKYLI